MHLIDTNIFLELLLDQGKKQKAQDIVSRVESGELNVIISGFSLHSIEFILCVKKKNDILREFIQALNEFPNLSVYHTTLEEDLKILEIVDRTPLDFDDANQYYIAKKFNAEIITFDKDFKVIQDVKVRILK
ncbi:MAG TPA: type II toxin-antitoxin system VapC family toxin [Candidatus Kapabacteria bacterium]|nr:type II toxin-antitoxin system VapC family toxin [Candidatus Kapabacteria bacterium]